MPLPFRVDWYALYGACVDVVWLADIILRHADILTNAAVALRVVQDKEQQQDIVLFLLLFRTVAIPAAEALTRWTMGTTSIPMLPSLTTSLSRHDASSASHSFVLVS